METPRRLRDELFLMPGVDRACMKSLWTPSTRCTGVSEDGSSAESPPDLLAYQGRAPTTRVQRILEDDQERARGSGTIARGREVHDNDDVLADMLSGLLCRRINPS